MRGLASFCLFGEDPDDIYRQGALKNAQAYLRYTPDVVCRFYVSPLSLKWASENLAGLPNVQIHAVETPGGLENLACTFWRFWALQDDSYDYYLFRDVDSRPILRERTAVQEWLESPRTFHVMRDHPYHNVPMLAGLWGVKRTTTTRNLYKIFPRKLSLLKSKSYYGVEQMYLQHTVWRQAKFDVLSHVDCQFTFGTEIQPFPEPITDEGFVGEGFYGDGRPRFPDHSRALVG